MTRQPNIPIVVGVDGTEEGLRAVRFAVAEALLVGCGVRLVHVLPELASSSPIVPLAGFEVYDDMARVILQQAELTAREASGDGVVLEKVVRAGTRLHVLVEASEDARLVVLGHRERTGPDRQLTASTSTGVATRARCPVVCIPSAWEPGHDHGRVVVGVEDPGHAHELLALAFAATARRHGSLTALHAWRLQRPYDDLVVGGSEAIEWTDSRREELGRAVGDLRAAFPEVDVELEVRHQDPAAALLAASDGADLLFLGRRGRGHGPALGFAIARALIREARCPVEITPLHLAAPEGAGRSASTTGSLGPVPAAAPVEPWAP